MPNTRNVPLTPYLNREERKLGRGANALFDCTWPLDWDTDDLPTKSSFDSISPKEIQQKVLTKLERIGALMISSYIKALFFTWLGKSLSDPSFTLLKRESHV
jgi:hypothetical protein